MPLIATIYVILVVCNASSLHHAFGDPLIYLITIVDYSDIKILYPLQGTSSLSFIRLQCMP